MTKPSFITEDGLLHYKNSGLDYIYLINGFEVHKTSYGSGYSIQDAENLHEMIALEIVTSPQQIRGQELRFLRSILELTQTELAKLIGIKRVRLAQLESQKDRPIGQQNDRSMRYLVAACKSGKKAVIEAVEAVKKQSAEMDNEINLVFEINDDGKDKWQPVAA